MPRASALNPVPFAAVIALIGAMEPDDLWVIQPRPDFTGVAAKLRPEPPRLFGRAFASIQPADEIVVIAGRTPAELPAAFPFVAVRTHTPDQPLRR